MGIDYLASVNPAKKYGRILIKAFRLCCGSRRIRRCWPALPLRLLKERSSGWRRGGYLI
jgi:hypothetical protein